MKQHRKRNKNLGLAELIAIAFEAVCSWLLLHN
jgi:hypothetical protein